VDNQTYSVDNQTYSVGGTISGFNSGNISIQNNGFTVITLNATNSFAFTGIKSGSGYSVTILSQPANLNCIVSNGIGVVQNSNITNILITCGVIPEITISNLKNTSIVNTGFVIGTAYSISSATIARVEVSLDNGSYQTATGTNQWKFKLPTGSSTWKLFTKHVINCRSIDSDGNISNIASVIVRKGNNKDINGDGYGDIAVSSSAVGVTDTVYIFLSTGANGISSQTTSTASATITGGLGDRFGFSISFGDVNGDGFADLLIGAFGVSANAGQVYLYLSNTTSIPSGTSISAAFSNFIGSGSEQAGVSVHLMDLNNDGFDDIVIGAPFNGGNIGKIYGLISQGATAVPTTALSSAPISFTDGTANSLLGGNITSGDFNGDGYADMVVSALGTGVNGSRVYIVNNPGGTGISSSSSVTTTLIGESNTDHFGLTISAADMNGDGYSDLLVTANNYSIGFANSGRGYLFGSSGTGIPSQLASSAIVKFTGSGTNHFVGTTGLAFDIDGDGIPEIILGGNGANSTYIFRGKSLVGGSNYDCITNATTTITGTSGGDLFGDKGSFADVNGDGLQDLMIASPLANTNGVLYIQHSTYGGIYGSGIAYNATTSLLGNIISFGSGIGR
jgi:hypothetical protein